MAKMQKSENQASSKDVCSIVIPIFNRERTVERTILSCLTQEHAAIELILVDDGSTDQSVEICKKFLKMKHRPGTVVRFVSQPNQGACAARNLGMSLATGNYLLFLDSDDTIPAEKISTQIAALNHKNADCCISDYRVIDEHAGSCELFKNELKPHQFISRLKSPSNSAIIMRRETIPKGMQWNVSLKRMQDFDFMLRYLATVKTWVYVPKALYNYHLHNGPRISDGYLKGMPYFAIFLSMHNHLKIHSVGLYVYIKLLSLLGLNLMKASFKDSASKILPISLKRALKLVLARSSVS